MKCQSLFSGKNEKTILNCHMLKFLSSMLSINRILIYFVRHTQKPIGLKYQDTVLDT